MPRVQPTAALLALAALTFLSPSAEAAPTDLDSSFGEAGVRRTASTHTIFATDVAAQPDGKLVVSASEEVTAPDNLGHAGDYDWIVARYSADGTLDPSFDGDGLLNQGGTGGYHGATAVAVDAAGGIYSTGELTGTDVQIVVNKVDASGSPAVYTGSLPIPGSERTTGRALAIQPDGKVVVVGEAVIGGVPKIVVARFLLDGEGDHSFDSDADDDGVIVLSDTACGGSACTASSVALSTTGSLVNAVYVGGTMLGSPNGGRVFRLTDGAGGFAVDSTYGGGFNGAAHLEAVGMTTVDDLVLRDGRVVAIGSAGVDCALARLTTDGQTDLGFATNGVGRITVGQECWPDDLAVDADGRFTFAGGTYDGSTAAGVLGRFTAAGSPDGTFVGGGAARVSPGGTPAEAQALLFQGSKIVTAGLAMSPHQIALARYVGGVIATSSSSGSGSSSGSPAPSTPAPSTPATTTNTTTTTTPATTTTSTTATPPPPRDSSAPAIAWTSPVDNGATNDSTPTFTGTASNDEGDATTIPIDFRVRTAAGYVTVPGYPARLTATRSGTTWSLALPRPLPDGTYFARAYLTDAAGNVAGGGNGAPILFRVDTRKPKISVDYPANNTRTTDPRPLVSGSTGNAEGDLTPVTVELRRATSDGDFVGLRRVRGKRSGTFWSVQLPRLRDARWSVRARLADDVGNSGLSNTVIFNTGKLATPTNDGDFRVDGDVEVGQVLGVRSTASWKPAEDLRVRYRWQRCADAGSPRDCETVTSLSDSAYYRVQSGDRKHKLRVAVYAENPDRQAPTRYSDLSRTVPPADQIPYIADQRYPRVLGDDISVNDVVDAYEGDWRGYPASLSYSYRWQICRAGGCTDVGTAKTYRVRPEDQGRLLNLVVTARNRAGSNYAWSGTGAPIAADRASRRRAMIVESYNKAFGRDPQSAEIAFWLPRTETLAELVANHQRFIRANRSTAEEVVRRVYEKVYGHGPYTKSTAALADQTAQFNGDVTAEHASGTTYDDLVTQYATALARQAMDQIFWWASDVSNRALVEPHVRNRDVSEFVDGVRHNAYTSQGSTRGENLWTEVALSNEPLHGAARTSYPGAGSAGAADRENCYGAVGPGCTGVPGGLSDKSIEESFTTLDGRKMAYLMVTTAVGSITHDAMCRVYPWTSYLKFDNGGWCGDAAFDPTEFLPIAKIWVTGAAEWNKATANTVQGRKWFEYYGPYPAPDTKAAMSDKHARTYSDDLRTAERQYRYTELTRGGVFLGIADLDKPFKWQGKEIRASLRLEAPAGVDLDSSDEDFCQSGQFGFVNPGKIPGQRDYNTCG